MTILLRENISMHSLRKSVALSLKHVVPLCSTLIDHAKKGLIVEGSPAPI